MKNGGKNKSVVFIISFQCKIIIKAVHTIVVHFIYYLLQKQLTKLNELNVQNKCFFFTKVCYLADYK